MIFRIFSKYDLKKDMNDEERNIKYDEKGCTII